MQRRLPYISASQFDTFLKCWLAYKYQYIDESERMPWTIYTENWWAIHKAFEENFRYKKKTWNDMLAKDVVEIFKQDFVKRCKGLIALGIGIEKDRFKILVDDGVGLVNLFMETIAPTLSPAEIEWSFEIPLEFKGAGLIVKWFADLITTDGRIIDYKNMGESTQDKWNQGVVNNSHQMTMYSLAFRKMFGRKEDDITIIWLKRLKKWPRIDSRSTTRTDTQVLALVQWLYQMTKVIDAWLIYPNFNSCTGCPFTDSCTRLSL